MADYFKNGPKFLEVDPTRDMPFVKVYDAEYTRGYQCPRVELIDVTHEIKQALLVRFQYATPEHCYACYLEAGSPTLWDIDYVKDGRLVKLSGRVKCFEFLKHNTRAPFTYNLNKMDMEDPTVVIQFDCSMDYDSRVVSIDITKLRRLQFSKANYDFLTDGVAIKVPNDAYNFMDRKFPIISKELDLLPRPLDTKNTIVADNMFALCYELADAGTLDATNLVSANSMFRECRKLANVKLENISKLTSANDMFYNNKELTSVDLSGSTDLRFADGIFYQCEKLESVKLDVTKLETADVTFAGCKELKDIELTPAKGLKTDLWLADSSKITDKTVTNIINALSPDVKDKHIAFPKNTECPKDVARLANDLITKGNWVLEGLVLPPKEVWVKETIEKEEEDKVIVKKDGVLDQVETKDDIVTNKSEDKKENTTPNQPGTDDTTHTVTPGKEETTPTEGTTTGGNTETPVAPVTPVEPVVPGTTEETHTETPEAGHTEENHEATPVVPSTGETHTETPVVPGTTEETHTSEEGHTEETHTETPVVPSTGEEHHEATPATPTPGEETHAAVDDTNPVLPATPATPSTGETHTETPVVPGTTEETHTEVPGTTEEHTEAGHTEEGHTEENHEATPVVPGTGEEHTGSPVGA